MSRKKLKQLSFDSKPQGPTEKLTELIPQYYVQKTEVDSLKKIVDKAKDDIKDLMEEAGVGEFETEGIKVTRSVSERQDFIEEALIEKLKQLKTRGIIKKREYVDMDALEDAIYKEKVNAADLAGCKTTKEVVTLRIKKIK